MGDCFTGDIFQPVNIGVVTNQLTDEHIVADSSLSRKVHQRVDPFIRFECGSLDSSCSSPDEEMLSPELDLTRNESFRQTIQRSHFVYLSRDRFLFRPDGGDGCDVFGSGQSSGGVLSELNYCASGLKARNSGPSTFNPAHDNCYGSNAFLCRFSDENSYSERDSSVLNNNTWSSTPVSIGVTRTSNICHDNDIKANPCDDRQPLIVGGARCNQSIQEEGIMSLAFPASNMSWEAVVCDSSSDESLPDFQDSFQCNHFSLISPENEAIDNHEELKRLNPNEAFSPVIECDSKLTASLTKPPGILKLKGDQHKHTSSYPPLISEHRPSNKKEHLRVSFNIPEFPDAGLHCMQQAAQGGSGKLPFVPVVHEEEEGDDDCLVEIDHGLSDVQPRDVFELSDDSRSGRIQDNFIKPAHDIISIFDGPNGYKRYYAAFLCCAQGDLEHFGISFHQMLEDWGFRIFLPPRDLVLTGCNFDNMSRALEERCNSKIIVVLSVNYEASEECSFLTSFAKILDPDSRKRNIVPVQIDKGVEMGNILKGLSIIYYNQDYKCRWLKRKLVDAIAA